MPKKRYYNWGWDVQLGIVLIILECILFYKCSTSNYRVAVRAHPGETSVTQAPVGSTYSVGTIIPVNVINKIKK